MARSELRAKLKIARAYREEADNVGERFPTEARKMHYGDIEHARSREASEEARAFDRRRRRVTRCRAADDPTDAQPPWAGETFSGV